jgi:phosphatidate phosphatase APP1
MAGLGKKTFDAGEVLTASDVNGYLMDQMVMVFPGTAARGSAIPSPSEGMITYRSDDKVVEVFNGTNYVSL